jgi:CHASE3 domain sensor protein
MRIRLAHSLVLLLHTSLAIALGVSFHAFSQAERRQTEAAQRQLQVSIAVSRFLAGSKQLTISVQSFAATGDPSFAEAYWREVYVTRNRDRAARTLQRLGLTSGESALLRQARAESDALIRTEREALDAGRAGQRDRAIQLVFGPAYQQALRRIYVPSEGLQRHINERMERAVQGESQRAEALWRLLVALLIMDLALVFVVLAVVTPRFITRPLVRLDRRLQQLLRGEPAAAVPLRGAAREIQDLALSLAAQERLSAQLARDRWAKAEQVRISALLQSEATPEAVAARFLTELAPLGLGAGSVYAVGSLSASLTLLSSYAGDAEPLAAQRLQRGEGLLGECLRQAHPLEIVDPPPGYLTVRSGLGSHEPCSLWLLPVRSGERVLAMVELALLRSLDSQERTLISDLLPFLALALEGLPANGQDHGRSGRRP